MEDKVEQVSHLYQTVFASLAILVAVFASTSIYLYQDRLDLRETNEERVRTFYSELSSEVGFTEAGDFVFSSGQRFDDELTKSISAKETFIAVDLSAMKVSLYKEGVLGETYPVLSKGREGSWWETPTGVYTVGSKERNHFSSIGAVWMPWSLQFYGNYFIHGWPYYQNGNEVSSAYSGGCVRLSTEDAGKVYAFANTGTKVLLLDQEPLSRFATLRPRLKQTPPPQVSARAFLVANLSTGEHILEKNAEDILPIASLTKLMTGVVTSELVYLERSLFVDQGELASSIAIFKPEAGERYIAFDLLYPLLMQSSNEAAELLSGYVGKPKFIESMNTKATSLLMSKTKFADASGVLSGNISTASDIENLLRYIYFKRQFLLDISKGKQDYRFDGRKLDNLANYNEFIDDNNLLGIKNGESTSAKQTLAGVWEFVGVESKLPVAFVVLGSDKREADTKALLEWFKENYEVI